MPYFKLECYRLQLCSALRQGIQDYILFIRLTPITIPIIVFVAFQFFMLNLGVCYIQNTFIDNTMTQLNCKKHKKSSIGKKKVFIGSAPERIILLHSIVFMSSFSWQSQTRNCREREKFIFNGKRELFFLLQHQSKFLMQSYKKLV